MSNVYMPINENNNDRSLAYVQNVHLSSYLPSVISAKTGNYQLPGFGTR